MKRTLVLVLFTNGQVRRKHIRIAWKKQPRRFLFRELPMLLSSPLGCAIGVGLLCNVYEVYNEYVRTYVRML